MNNISKIKYYISNLNVMIILIGYPFVVSVFIPFLGNMEGATRLLTVPFRIFTLIICLLTLLLNLENNLKKSVPITFFFLFWVLVLLRILYDLEIRTDFNIPFEYKYQIWLFAVFLCFLPMLSLYFSYKVIDLDLCLKYIYIGCVIILFFSFKTTLNSNEGDRIQGNIALDSISFAQISLTTSILSIYKFFQNKNKSFFLSFFYFFITFLSLYVGLKSGSRGPLLGFLIVLLIWNVFRRGSVFSLIFKFISLIVILAFFSGLVISSISLVSPLTASRLTQASDGTDMSVLERQETYFWFFNNILENPFFGSQFARLSNTDFPGYAHNIFLDILLGFGIFGLLLFLYIILKSFIVIKEMIRSKSHFWIGLFMIQAFIVSISSGAYYSDPVLNCSILLVLLGNFKYNNFDNFNLANERYNLN